jgi:PAS fold
MTLIVILLAGQTARFRGAANTAKGTPRYWDVQVSPIFGAHGQISQLLSISRDITEELEAAERERGGLRRLDAANWFRPSLRYRRVGARRL